MSVSNELATLSIRMAVKRGDISYKDVMFKFEGKLISIGPYGQVWDWPDGFCDYLDKCFAELFDI